MRCYICNSTITLKSFTIRALNLWFWKCNEGKTFKKLYLSYTFIWIIAIKRMSSLYQRDLLQMGLKYGCSVEDVLTGLSIHSRGWRSVYFNPERKAFIGIVPTTLLQSLVQHKRWTEGDLQIFLSKHCPFVYGRERMRLKLRFHTAFCYCGL